MQYPQSAMVYKKNTHNTFYTFRADKKAMMHGQKKNFEIISKITFG